MTIFGIFMMIISNTLVLLLTGFCFYRVLAGHKNGHHEHASLQIDTHDEDPAA